MTATAVPPSDLAQRTVEPVPPLEALRRECETLRARLSELQHRLEYLETQVRGSGDTLPVVRAAKATHPLAASHAAGDSEVGGPPHGVVPGDAPSLRDLIDALTAGAAWSRPTVGARGWFLPGKDTPFLNKVGARLGHWTRLFWLIGAAGLALLVIVVLLRLRS